MPQDLKKAQTYGGHKICFENDEVTGLKRFDLPGNHEYSNNYSITNFILKYKL